MSEVKKITELNDKELEKVNGGFNTKPVTVTSYSFTAGDCFAQNSRRIRIVKSRDNVLSGQTITVELSENYSDFNPVNVPVDDNIFREEYFVGNNVF